MAIPPVLNIVLFVLMLSSWAVQLGGTAAYHDEASNLSDATKRVMWWAVWFEFFLLLVCVICIVMGKMDEWKGVLVAFCAMCSAYLMPVAEMYLSFLDNGGLSSKWEDIFRTCAAGTIMVIIVNWICIILYGNDSFREMVEAKAEAIKGEPTA